ncbi:hypothetical protein C8T65DRAFT_736261 [Cerioporus squamosus]|nr:hypothetical protein C8T65DRAFT_736261 [Cerioporus squamosus]
MFTFEFYLICLAFAGYVLLSHRWAVVAPPARRRPRQGVPRPPAARGGGAQPPVVAPRRRVVRPSAVSINDHVEILEINPPARALPATRSGPRPPSPGVFALRPSVLGHSAPLPSAPLPSASIPSALHAPAPGRSVASPAAISRHPTEELDPELPVPSPDRAANHACAEAAPLYNSPIRWRERRVGGNTFYWEPEKFALQLIQTPPDLTGDPKLALGDLFFFQTLTRYKFWIWTLDDSEKAYWKAIRYGFQREDGRRLIVTPAQRKPGWVKQERWSQLSHELRLLDAYGEVW